MLTLTTQLRSRLRWGTWYNTLFLQSQIIEGHGLSTDYYRCCGVFRLFKGTWRGGALHPPKFFSIPRSRYSNSFFCLTLPNQTHFDPPSFHKSGSAPAWHNHFISLAYLLLDSQLSTSNSFMAPTPCKYTHQYGKLML